MALQPTDVHPFYDPYRQGSTLAYPQKIGISLGVGAFYLLLQYYAMPNKMEFFDQYCWILGIIISTALLALYVATDIFRRSLIIMQELSGDSKAIDEVVSVWLNNKWYLIAGLGFATVNTSVAHLLGVPAEFHVSALSLAMMYVGFFLAGFASGMGLLGISGIIVVYLKFAPSLQYALNPDDPDGNGGIKKLGDALWFFGMLTGAVGVLVSLYMFGVQWTYIFKPYVQIILLLWVAFPYIVAISIVLIPGLAVRRQVNNFKANKTDQLKREKAQTYASYKKFDHKDDAAIVSEKKELSDRLIRIQDELEKLREMRNSHIDGKN